MELGRYDIGDGRASPVQQLPSRSGSLFVSPASKPPSWPGDVWMVEASCELRQRQRKIGFCTTQTSYWHSADTSTSLLSDVALYEHHILAYFHRRRPDHAHRRRGQDFGQPIGKDWFQRPRASRLKILAHLKKYVDEMRTLSTQSKAIGSFSGDPLYGPRMPSSTRQFGPFNSVEEFHEYIRDGVQAHSCHNDGVANLIRLHGQQWDAPSLPMAT